MGNRFGKIDIPLVVCYLMLVFIGWINIYAAVYSQEHSSIFDMSQRYGMQFTWIITAIVLAVMGMLFSLWEDGIGFGIILAALFVHLFSACACWYWQRKLTNEEEETNDEP